MKKIWMIEKVSRVIDKGKWSEPMPMYAYKSKKKAKLDINYTKDIENDGYLEYKYIITEYNYTTTNKEPRQKVGVF